MISVVYDESIFALEPSTVRVREVGVSRHERRAARRERERERAARASEATEHESGSSRPMAQPSEDSAQAVANPSSLPSAQTNGPTATGDLPTSSMTVEGASSAAPANEAPAFTTFQQLLYIPPVPASVLAPAYVIPPTYDSVISSSSMPSQPVQTENQTGPPPPSQHPNAPLLSPISLLSNHPARANGPPGLFYVSRGKFSTNIVDADGRSVIKRAIQWKDDTNAMIESGNDPDMLRALHVFHRIEIMLTAGKTIMVGIGATEIQAVELGSPGTEGNVHVIPEAAVKRRTRPIDTWDNLRDVVYLGSAGKFLFSSLMS